MDGEPRTPAALMYTPLRNLPEPRTTEYWAAHRRKSYLPSFRAALRSQQPSIVHNRISSHFIARRGVSRAGVRSRTSCMPRTSRTKEPLAMKRVDAVIRPSQLESVKQRITQLGVTGLTVSEVRGFGRQKGHTETYRGAEYNVDFLPKILITLVIPEDLVDPVVEAILEGARTGVIGDGKIFVS